MAADASGGARPAHGVSTGLYVFTFILTGVAIPDFDAPGGFLTATVHVRVAGRLEEIVPIIRAVAARARENQAGQAQAAMTGALGAFVDGADPYLPSMVLQLRSGSKLVNQTSVSSEYVRLTADLTAPVISAELAKAPLFALLGLFGVTEAYEAAVIRVFQAIMRAAQKVGLTGVIRAVEELDIAAMNAALRKLRDEHAAATGGKGAVGAGGKPPAVTGGKAGADDAAAGGGKTPPPATTTTDDAAAGGGKAPPPAYTAADDAAAGGDKTPPPAYTAADDAAAGSDKTPPPATTTDDAATHGDKTPPPVTTGADDAATAGAGKGARPVAEGAAAAATDAGKAGAAAGGADAGKAGGARATEGGSVTANPYLKQVRQHLAGLLSTATIGTLVPLGIDLGAQDIQVRRGHRPGRDEAQARTMGLIGLAGSPVGYGTAVGLGRLAQGAEKAGLHGVQNHWVTHVVIEALTEADAGAAGSVAVTHQYDGPLLGDLSSGATEGVANRVGDRVAAALPDPKAALPPGGLQLPDIPPVAPPVPPAAEPETTGAGTTTPAPTQAAPASPQNEEPPTPVAVQPPPATASISDTAGILDRTGSDAGSESDPESVSGSSVATETSSVVSRVSSASSVSSLASDGSDGGKGYSGSSRPLAGTLTSPGPSGTPAAAASATPPTVDAAGLTAALKQRVDLAAAERVVTKLTDAVPPPRAALLDELAAKTTPPPAADPTPATTTPAGGPAPKTTWPQAWNTVLSGPAGTDAPPADHPLIQGEKHVTISAAAGGEHAASPVQVRTVRLPDPPAPPDLPGQSAPAHPTKLDEYTVRAQLIPDPQAGPKVTPAALTNLADTMRSHAATLWGTPQHAGDGTFVRVKFEPIVGRLTGPHLLDGPIPQLRIDQHALTNPTSLLQHAVGDVLGLDANATTAGLPADAAARLAELATAAEAPVTPALPKDGWLPPPAIVNPTTWAPPPHPTPPAGRTGEHVLDGWPPEWNDALDHARPNAPASTIAVDSGLLPVPLDHADPAATDPPEPDAQAWLDWIDRLSWPAGHEPAALLQVRRVPLTHPDTGKTTVVVEATLPVAVVPEPGAAVPPGALAATTTAAKAQLDQLNQHLKSLPPALVHGQQHVVQLRWQDTEPDAQPGFVLAVPGAGAPAQPLGKLASWRPADVAELLAQTHTPAPPPHGDLLTAAAGQLAKRAWTVPAATGGRPGPAGARAFQARTATIAHTPPGDPHRGATVPPGHHTAVDVAALHVWLNPSTADAEPVTERELAALADRIQSQVDKDWNTLPYLHDAGSRRLLVIDWNAHLPGDPKPAADLAAVTYDVTVHRTQPPAATTGTSISLDTDDDVLRRLLVDEPLLGPPPPGKAPQHGRPTVEDTQAVIDRIHHATPAADQVVPARPGPPVGHDSQAPPNGGAGSRTGWEQGPQGHPGPPGGDPLVQLPGDRDQQVRDVHPVSLPQAIDRGVVLAGRDGTGAGAVAAALRSHYGYYTIGVHFNQSGQTVTWGDHELTAQELEALVPTLPGWAEAVAENDGAKPKLILVSCGASGAPPGAGAYLSGFAKRYGQHVFGLTPYAHQRRGGDIVAEQVVLHHPDGVTTTAFGPDLSKAIGEHEAEHDRPAIAITPDQEQMPEAGYMWSDSGPSGTSGGRASYRTGGVGDSQQAPGRNQPSEQQLAALPAMQLIPAQVEAGGNCLFEALARTAPEEIAAAIDAFLANASVPADLLDGLRGVTADELRIPNLETIRRVRLAMARMFRHDHANNPTAAVYATLEADVGGQVAAALVPAVYAAQIARGGEWEGGTLWPPIAAHVFGINLRVLHDDGTLTRLNDQATGRPRTLIHIRYPADAEHYQATLDRYDPTLTTGPITHDTPLPDAITVLDTIETGLPDLGRAVDAARAPTRRPRAPAELGIRRHQLADLVRYVVHDPRLAAARSGQHLTPNEAQILQLQLIAVGHLHHLVTEQLGGWQGAAAAVTEPDQTQPDQTRPEETPADTRPTMRRRRTTRSMLAGFSFWQPRADTQGAAEGDAGPSDRPTRPVPEPWSGSVGAEEVERVLAHHGLAEMPIPPELPAEEHFYYSILKLVDERYLRDHVFRGRGWPDDRPLFGADGEPRQDAVLELRGWLADWLAPDFAAANEGFPTRYAGWFPYRPGEDRQAQQSAWVNEIRAPRSWNPALSELVPWVMVDALGLPAALARPDGVRYLGPAGAPAEFGGRIVLVLSGQGYVGALHRGAPPTIDWAGLTRPEQPSAVDEYGGILAEAQGRLESLLFALPRWWAVRDQLEEQVTAFRTAADEESATARWGDVTAPDVDRQRLEELRRSSQALVALADRVEADYDRLDHSVALLRDVRDVSATQQWVNQVAGLPGVDAPTAATVREAWVDVQRIARDAGRWPTGPMWVTDQARADAILRAAQTLAVAADVYNRAASAALGAAGRAVPVVDRERLAFLADPVRWRAAQPVVAGGDGRPVAPPVPAEGAPVLVSGATQPGRRQSLAPSGLSVPSGRRQSLRPPLTRRRAGTGGPLVAPAGPSARRPSAAKPRQPPPRPERERSARVQNADTADANLVFAPPKWAVSADPEQQATGNHTAEPVGDLFLDAVRSLVRDQVPQAVHREVNAELDRQLRSFYQNFEQAHSDELPLLPIKTSAGVYYVTVNVQLGNWEQVTDPKGNVLDPDRHRDLAREPGKSELRTRQTHTVGVSSGTSRSYNTSAVGSGALTGEKDTGADVVTKVPYTFTESAPLANKTLGRNTTDEVTTSATGKGSSYRSVDFVHDGGVIVTVKTTGKPATIRADVVNRSLLLRYPREVCRSRDRDAPTGKPDDPWHTEQGTPRGATSALWTAPVGEQDVTTDAVRRSHEAVLRRHEEATTARERAAAAHQAAAARREVMPGSFPGQGRPDGDGQQPQSGGGIVVVPPPPPAGDGAAGPSGSQPQQQSQQQPQSQQQAQPTDGQPADGQPADAQRPAMRLPRDSWPEAVANAARVRAAALGVLDPVLTGVDTESREALRRFLTVAMLKGGGLQRMLNGGLLSPVLAERDDAGQWVRDALLFTAELVEVDDPVREWDEFTRPDANDSYANPTGTPRSVADSWSPGFALGMGLLKTAFSFGLQFVPSMRRQVTLTRPGANVGSTSVHNVKYTREPQSLFPYRVRVRVTSLTKNTTSDPVDLRVLYRLLYSDAIADAALKDRFTNRLPPAKPTAPYQPQQVPTTGNQEEDAERAAAEQYRRRTDPFRMLLLPPQFGGAEFQGWLPPWHRVRWWGEEVVDVVDNAVDFVSRRFPSYLPGVTVEPLPTSGPRKPGMATRVRLGEGWIDGYANLVKIWNSWNPTDLAGRMSEVVATDEIVLVNPGYANDSFLVLKLRASYDRTNFRYERTLGGVGEYVSGASADLKRSMARESRADVNPLNFLPTGQGAKLPSHLAEIDGNVSVVPKVSISRAHAENSGLGVSGGTIAGSDYEALFEGSFSFRVSAVEMAVELSTPIPGALPGTETAPDHPRDRTTRTPQEGTAFTVSAKLVVPEDLCLEVDVGDTERMGLRKRATAELYTLATRSALPPIQIGSSLVDPEDTLQWYADPDLPYGRFPPRGALLMNTSGIALAIFTQMDAQGVLCLSATEYDELLGNVKAVGPRSRSYLGGPRLLWRGRVRWGPHKNKMVDVYLELQPDRIDAVGRTDHAYTLQQGTVDAVLGRTRTRDPGPWGWSWSLSGRLAFPVKLVKDGSHKLTSAASVGYSKSKPHSQGLDLSGSSERLDIELSNHVWGNFQGVWVPWVRVYERNDFEGGAAHVVPTAESAEDAEPSETPAPGTTPTPGPPAPGTTPAPGTPGPDLAAPPSGSTMPDASRRRASSAARRPSVALRPTGLLPPDPSRRRASSAARQSSLALMSAASGRRPTEVSFTTDRLTEWETRRSVPTRIEPIFPDERETGHPPEVRPMPEPRAARPRIAVPAVGIVLLRLEDAVNRGLATADEEGAYPGLAAFDRWRFHQEARGGYMALQDLTAKQLKDLPPGTLLPPRAVLFSDTEGHSAAIVPLDLLAAHPLLMADVRRLFRPSDADAIEDELTPITEANLSHVLLPELLKGISLPIAHRGLLTQWTHTLEAKARLEYAAYAGPASSRMIIGRTLGGSRSTSLTEATTSTWSLPLELLPPSYTVTFTPEVDAALKHLPHDFLREFSLGSKLTLTKATNFALSASDTTGHSSSIFTTVKPEKFVFNVELDFKIMESTAWIGSLEPLFSAFQRGLDLLGLKWLRPYLVGETRVKHDFEPVVPDPIILGYPRQLTQIDPRARITEVDDEETDPAAAGGNIANLRVRKLIRDIFDGVPARLDPANPRRPEPLVEYISDAAADRQRGWRRGPELTPAQLSGMNVTSAPMLEIVRTAVKLLLGHPRETGVVTNLFDNQRKPKTSFQTGPQATDPRIDTLLTETFVKGNWRQMQDGDEFEVELRMPGRLWDSDATLKLAIDIVECYPVDYDPRTGVTIDNQILKDTTSSQTSAKYSQSSTESAQAAVTATLKGTTNTRDLPLTEKSPKSGSGAKPTATSTPAPTPTAASPPSTGEMVPVLDKVHVIGPQVGVNATASATTVTTPGSTKSSAERGDKRTGADITRIVAREVTYRAELGSHAVKTTLYDEAMVFLSPTEGVAGLLDAPRRDGQPRLPKPAAFRDEEPDIDLLDYATKLDELRAWFVDPQRQARQGEASGEAVLAAADAARAALAEQAEQAEQAEAAGTPQTPSAADIAQVVQTLADRIDDIVRSLAAINQHAEALGRLRLGDEEVRLRELTNEELVLLGEHTHRLKDATVDYDDAVYATGQALHQMPAPPRMLSDQRAEARDTLAALNGQYADQRAKADTLENALRGAEDAGVDVSELRRPLTDAENRMTRTAGPATEAGRIPEDLAGLQALDVQLHYDALREREEALNNWRKVVEAVDHDFADLPVASRQRLVTYVTTHDRDNLRDDTNHADRRIRLDEWLDAARERGADTTALAERLRNAAEAVERADRDTRRDIHMSLVDLARLTARELTQRAADVPAQNRPREEYRAALQDVETHLRNNHDQPGVRPPTVGLADQLRREIPRLRVEMADVNQAALAGRAARFEDMITRAEDDGAEVGAARQRLAEVDQPAQTLAALTAPPRHGPDPATYTLRQVRQVHTELADYRDAQTEYSQAIRSVGTALTAIPLPQAVVDRINGLRNQLQEHGGRRDEQLATMQEAVDAAAAAGIDVRAGQQQVDDDRARLPTRLPTTAQLRDDPLQMTTPAAYDLEDSLQAAVNSAGDLATQTRLRANTLLESLTEALSVPMRGFHTAIRDDQASEPARRDREARLRAWLEQAETAGHEVGQLRNNLDTANARVTQASDALGALPETLDHLDVPALARLHPGMRELHDAIAARNQTLEDVENELAGTGVPRPAADHAPSDTSHPPPPGPQPGPAPDSQAPDSQRPDSQRPATPESRAPRGTSRPGTSANYEALATAFQAADPPALDPGETVDDQVRALAALAAAVDGDRATRTALATGEPETVARTDRATRLLPPAPEGGYGHTAWLSSEQLDHYVPGMPVNLPHLVVTQPGRPTRREGHNVRFVVQTAQGRAAGPLLDGDHTEVALPRGAHYDVIQVTEPDYTGMREIHLRDTVPAAPGGDAVDTLPAGIPVAEEPRSPQITAATAQQSSDQPTGSLSGWEIGAPASAGQHHLGRSADLRRGQ